MYYIAIYPHDPMGDRLEEPIRFEYATKEEAIAALKRFKELI